MIVSLVQQGTGIGVLTSLDVATEVQRGLLQFTRLTDPVLRPMTLALCTATARTPSHAAGIVLGELEAGFAQLGYPAAHQVPDEAECINSTDINRATDTPLPLARHPGLDPGSRFFCVSSVAKKRDPGSKSGMTEVDRHKKPSPQACPLFRRIAHLLMNALWRAPDRSWRSKCPIGPPSLTKTKSFRRKSPIMALHSIIPHLCGHTGCAAVRKSRREPLTRAMSSGSIPSYGVRPPRGPAPICSDPPLRRSASTRFRVAKLICATGKPERVHDHRMERSLAGFLRQIRPDPARSDHQGARNPQGAVYLERFATRSHHGQGQ